MRLKILIYLKLLILLTSRSQTHASLDDSSIALLMKVMLPSMFGLFSNITEAEFKAQFKEPCTFDKLLEIFSKLPPYFDEFGKKYSKKPELMAYYSMQLASTFLVNNGSLTMDCLYNMLSLQTKLQKFSLDLMDYPEKNFHLVGLFGTYMKPMMAQLKQNAMMKIIDHVDRYEKNDDYGTIRLFNYLNVFYIITGFVAILANVFLIIILKKSNKSKLELPEYSTKKTYKTAINDLNYNLRKRYKTRLCFIVIAICHAAYILLNFIVMSQASLASVALKGLTKLSLACKIAFFMFPPTTAYNICHQIYVWLLVYIIRKHATKLRTIRTIDLEDNLSDEDNYMSYNDRFQDRSQVPFTLQPYPVRSKVNKNESYGLFSRKRRNLLVTFFIMVLLFIYNSQNLIFYSLNKLVDASKNTIYFCAFDEQYSDYYFVLTQIVAPWLNLILFWLLPFVLGLVQILFDVCFLLRIKREQEKRYLKLKSLIEWPVYCYFIIFAVSQLPFTVHQIVDLCSGAVKFPFVFPLFIQMKFSNKVGLVVFEQTLIFAGLSCDLLVWLLFDKDFKKLSLNWLNKRICCSTSQTNLSNTSSGMSDKSGSDTSVTNPSKSSKSNGYESSTLTSTTSSSRKKVINLADSIKATAAIPASIQVNSNYPYEDDSKSDSNAIKMIDTDNDEFDNLNDLSIEKQNLERLSEMEHDEEMDRKNVSLSNPPSFNAAISRNTYKKGMKYDHQYQNV